MTKKQQAGYRTKETSAVNIPFPDEISHLKKISDDLDRALVDATAYVERIDKDYRDAKRYMAQYRGEIDPHEMFQNELGLMQIDRSGAFAVEVRNKIVKMKDSPYFAFCSDTDKESQIFYIGRFAFNHDDKLLISDWRSPVASMFYDYEIGPADYLAPAGRIKGALTRKRQFKIKNGMMEYALETSANIQDDILQRELSHTSDEKMKSIIATIQKEQNQIIRNESSATMIIQGVAGSGKTSIALHRIAFLLYRFRGSLMAKNITILSPNKVFADYIGNVLPELGEESIHATSFLDIAKEQLEGVIDFEIEKEPLNIIDTKLAERVQFKSTLDFVKQMDQFIDQMPDIAFEPVDFTDGRFMATADNIRTRFHAYRSYPVKRRLQMVAEYLHNCFDKDHFMDDDIPKAKTILKALNKMLRIKNTLALYKEFYKRDSKLNMFMMPSKKALEWSDVYPFLYLHAAFEGLHENNLIKHLVVDEMQDYTPIQYAVINRLFRCPKTILGDFGQSINPNHLHSLEDIKHIYTEAQFVELCKSYRSTYEIMSFAKLIKRTGTIEAIERHGDPPSIIKCLGRHDELMRVGVAIAAFSNGKYASLGIIAKTDQNAKWLSDALANDYDVHLLTPDSTHFTNGVTITTIPLSKGLEFDEVILPDVNSDIYCTEYDRSLLYIACTRAMHRLTLFYDGALSPLLEAIASGTGISAAPMK